MMALSGVRSSWLILARNFDLAWLASSARVFLLGVFLGQLGELLGLPLQRLLRGAQVGDRRHQPLLAVDQLLLVQLERGDVGADRDVAAVLGAPLADVQPAAVVELRLEGAGAGDCGPSLETLLRTTGLRPAATTVFVRRRRPRSPRRAGRAAPGISNCTAPAGCRRPTARRLPGWSRSRRAGACRRRRSSRPAVFCSVMSTAMPIRCGPGSPGWRTSSQRARSQTQWPSAWRMRKAWSIDAGVGVGELRRRARRAARRRDAPAR